MPATRVFAVTGFTLPEAGYRGHGPLQQMAVAATTLGVLSLAYRFKQANARRHRYVDRTDLACHRDID